MNTKIPITKHSARSGTLKLSDKAINTNTGDV